MVRIIRFLDDTVDLLLALALILVLLVGVYFIYDTAYVYYNAAAERVSFWQPGTETKEDVPARPYTEDYAAWLVLDDTEIAYPIMQGKDNSQYLNTDPYGDYSLSGSIFLDSRCSRDFSDSYCLVYGHHMSNYLMFGALDRFYDESYFARHRTGTLTVGDAVYPLQVFALLSTDAGDEVIFEIVDSGQVLQTARENSINYIEPVSEHVLALTTCVDAMTNTRTVLLCAMGEAIPEGDK